ncbi:transposase [Streptomyces sp. NPDC003832]
MTGRIAGCFESREPRALAREMCGAMLMEQDTRNCWTLAEALGHSGPNRLQHFLSRAAVDHDTARDRIAACTAGELADTQAVLVVDETGDEKSSTDCVGAARQYSGALGGIGLCQVSPRTSPTPPPVDTPRSTVPSTWARTGQPTKNAAC